MFVMSPFLLVLVVVVGGYDSGGIDGGGGGGVRGGVLKTSLGNVVCGAGVYELSTSSSFNCWWWLLLW